MGANLPRRRRPAAAREPVQRSDGGEARLWHLGTALAVSFTVAVVGLAGLAWLAWVLLGLAGYRHHGAPALKDTVGVLQLVFATVAGAGALVALIVAYRRQKITEADSLHDRTRVFNERFTAIAAQLGGEQPAVRLAGVHAMAGLADDWKQNRQTCVDVLCAYLRLPYDPDLGADADPAERTAYRANREVRHTIIRLIGAHLRPRAAVSWQDLDLDFTGVVFDGGDFSGAEFSGGTVTFRDAEFSGGLVDFSRAGFSGGTVGFRGARFSGGTVDFGGGEFSGGTVGFDHAEFSGGLVDFSRAEFSDGEVGFLSARFSGGTVGFLSAGFSGGTVRFDYAGFSGSAVRFDLAGFSGGTMQFGVAEFSGGLVSFSRVGFSGGEVGFRGARFSGGVVDFDHAEFSGGAVGFEGAVFSGGAVRFADASRWSHPPMFSWDGEPPAGVVLPVQPPEETRGKLQQG
jgi:uncharacterized protein YjbI with pentapeptide repeats